MDSIAVKSCCNLSCQNENPQSLEAFYKQSKAKDGRQPICKTCAKAKAKQWYQDNPDRARESRRKWAIDNPEKISAAVERRRKNAPETNRARSLRYYYRYPERVLALTRLRRNKDRGKHTAQDVAAKLELQGGRCYYCKKDIERGFHVDHKIPASKGGPNWPANICCACASCNRSKSDSDFWGFLEKVIARIEKDAV